MLLALLTYVALGPGPAAVLRDYVATKLEMDIGAPSNGQPFDAVVSDDPPLVRIGVVGDVGTGDAEEYETATAMDALPGPNLDALVLLGDNVYPSGDPERLDATVFEPFGPVLGQGTDLVAALGNHDAEDGNAPGQMDALGMPGRWYTWRSGPALLVVLDSTRPGDPEQLAWLRRTLASTDATWKIVALHHPPYSSGWHGSATDVRAAFQPIFERYGVQLVLAGHDHDYQRSEPIDGTTYVVSGAAARTRPTSRAGFTAVAWSTQHFVDIAIWSNRLELQAVAQDGLIYDRVEIRPSR